MRVSYFDDVTGRRVMVAPACRQGTIVEHFAEHLEAPKPTFLLRVIPPHNTLADTSDEEPAVDLYSIPFDSGIDYPLIFSGEYEVPCFDELVRLGSVKEFIYSRCGYVFDQYIRDHFDVSVRLAYSALGPTSKSFPDLWSGRRLRILLSRESPKWHVAKVKGMEQFCTGPFSSNTRWRMTLEFEGGHDGKDDGSSFQPGDYVELLELKTSKELNGKSGVVLEHLRDSGRLRVQIATKLVSLKPENLRRMAGVDLTEWTREVHRLHPKTGGVLAGDGSTDPAEKISFEWLDAPVPKMKECDIPDVERLQFDLTRFFDETYTEASLEGRREARDKDTLIMKQSDEEYLDELLHLSKTDIVKFGRKLLEEPLEKFFRVMKLAVKYLGRFSEEAFKFMLAIATYRCRSDSSWRCHARCWETMCRFLCLLRFLASTRHSYLEAFALARYAVALARDNGFVPPRDDLGPIYGGLIAACLDLGDTQKAFHVLNDCAPEASTNLAPSNLRLTESNCDALRRESSEWMGTSEYTILEDGMERVHKGSVRPRPFAVVGPSSHSDFFTNCPINFPSAEFSPAPEKMVKSIVHQVARDSFVTMINGTFTTEWFENGPSVHFFFYADEGPLRHEKELLDLHFSEWAGAAKLWEGDLTTDREKNLRRYLPDGVRTYAPFRMATIFLKHHSDRLLTVDSQKLSKHLWTGFVAKQQWKDAYPASVLFACLALSPNKDSAADIKVDACQNVGNALECLGNFDQAASVYLQGCELVDTPSSKAELCYDAGT
jgi:hypothetical protein